MRRLLPRLQHRPRLMSRSRPGQPCQELRGGGSTCQRPVAVPAGQPIGCAPWRHPRWCQRRAPRQWPRRPMSTPMLTPAPAPSPSPAPAAAAVALTQLRQCHRCPAMGAPWRLPPKHPKQAPAALNPSSLLVGPRRVCLTLRRRSRARSSCKALNSFRLSCTAEGRTCPVEEMLAEAKAARVRERRRRRPPQKMQLTCRRAG